MQAVFDAPQQRRELPGAHARQKTSIESCETRCQGSEGQPAAGNPFDHFFSRLVTGPLNSILI